MPWRAAAASLLCLAVIAAVVVGARIARSDPSVATGPLAVVSTPQPGAATKACQSLMAALPSTLAGLPRRTVLYAGAGVAAWGSGSTADDALVLRCGIGNPDQLTCSSYLDGVDDVFWLQLSDIGSTTYIAADRSVRIALTIPDGSGTGAIQQISTVVGATLPSRAPCDGHGHLQPLATT